MSQSIVEKAAKIICPNDFNSPEGHDQGQCEYCDSARDIARDKAKAVIACLTIDDLSEIINEKIFEEKAQRAIANDK